MITTWRKSTHSGGGNSCVEVALREVPAIRDSKRPDHPHLAMAPACWVPFLAALKAGHFDR